MYSKLCHNGNPISRKCRFLVDTSISTRIYIEHLILGVVHKLRHSLRKEGVMDCVTTVQRSYKYFVLQCLEWGVEDLPKLRDVI